MQPRYLLGVVAVVAAAACEDSTTETSAGPGAGGGGDAGQGGVGAQGGAGAQGGGGQSGCTSNASCDDGNACTDDLCSATGNCEYSAVDCDDGMFCNGEESCDPGSGCQAGTAVDPDDGVDCTDDACDEDHDVITNTANDDNCDDTVDCTDDTCDATNDCVFTPNNANCDDTVGCTDDTCDATNDCVFTANDANCDDGVGCTNNNCDLNDDCSFTPVNANCDDAEACTADSCDAVADCRNIASSPACGSAIVITEIMQNPNALADGEGEWFEVTNTGAFDFDIGGCTIADDGSDSHVIAGALVVPKAGARVTLADGAAPGFVPNYVYSGVALDDGLDELVLRCGGQELARVNWDDGLRFPDPDGSSMALAAAHASELDAYYGRYWCSSTTAFGSGDLGTPGAANDACPIIRLIDLTGAQENPATGSAALGQCTVTLNAAQTQIEVSCVHNVANPTMAHIHLGNPGVNGAIQINLGNGSSPIEVTAAVNAMDVTNFLAGSLYINVHSTAFGGGEIRGQIRPEIVHSHFATGAQQVPPVATTAIGLCSHAEPFGKSFFEVWCTHSAVAPNMAHIHSAAAGANGPVIVGFTSPVTPIFERVAPTAGFFTDLAAGNLYVNIHTAAFGGGEIRGQIP